MKKLSLLLVLAMFILPQFARAESENARMGYGALKYGTIGCVAGGVVVGGYSFAIGMDKRTVGEAATVGCVGGIVFGGYGGALAGMMESSPSEQDLQSTPEE